MTGGSHQQDSAGTATIDCTTTAAFSRHSNNRLHRSNCSKLCWSSYTLQHALQLYIAFNCQTKHNAAVTATNSHQAAISAGTWSAYLKSNGLSYCTPSPAVKSDLASRSHCPTRLSVMCMSCPAAAWRPSLQAKPSVCACNGARTVPAGSCSWCPSRQNTESVLAFISSIPR
jgi:hypothetical protein